MSALDMPLSAIMTKDVASIPPTTPVEDAVRKMLEHGVLGLPVEDAAGAVVGVFSMTDALWAAQESAAGEAENSFYDAGALLHLIHSERPVDRAKLPVSSLMNQHVVALEPDATVQEAAALMSARRIHRILVLDDAKHLLGVVTTLDVCRHVSS
ncbi:MAG: CBS domain-containing protein [Polyangiaceae bacterium]